MYTTMDKDQLQLETKIFKGLGDQSRLHILHVLAEEPKTVSDIVEVTQLSQPNVSMHLACLLDCGLVKREKQGRQVYYRTATAEIEAILASARTILQEHAKEIYDCTRY
ncbi:MAG TPA: metalloregulator ArsR/SmtB family transcription factor [Patescibacteria group bacterium]